MDNWRLIINPPNPGAWNMALDEAILESVTRKIQPPTLRLYAWHPYTLSLGHAQPFSDVDIKILKKRDWDVVRRPTGGRAILHADELTYSITAPADDLHVSGNVVESYRLLSTGLLKALEIIGIQADSRPKNEQENFHASNPVCFQYPSDYEITYLGKKLIGSAQARRNQGVLQHGAIPLYGDISRIITVLNYPSDIERSNAKSLLLQRATTVSEILGKFISWQDVADALKQGFEQALNVNLIHQTSTPDEKNRAVELLKEKYANDRWTMRI